MSQYNYPKGHSYFETFLRSFKLVNNPLEAMNESMEKFGDTYSISAANFRTYIATKNPDFIEHVLKKNHRNYQKSDIATEKLGKYIGKGLLTSNGAHWLKQRRLIQPGFHIEKLKILYGIMKQTIDGFVKSFPTGNSVDVYPHMNRLAFDVVLNTLFNTQLPGDSRQLMAKFISDIQEYVVREIRQPHLNWWLILSGQTSKNLRKAKKLRSIIQNIVVQRKESGEKYNDLLDMLLESRYEDTGQPMEEDQLIDEIIILMVAGHETTANALSWMLYLLATNEDKLSRLNEELHGLDLEAVIKNKYAQAVINESMRLFPPVWITDRVCMNSDQWNGYTFPGRTVVIMYLFGLHHSAKQWEKPNDFFPERFLRETARPISQNIFYPFGAGPRLCIGNNFAMAEMALFLQAFNQKFSIHPTGYEPKKIPLVTLRPDKVLLRISKK